MPVVAGEGGLPKVRRRRRTALPTFGAKLVMPSQHHAAWIIRSCWRCTAPEAVFHHH